MPRIVRRDGRGRGHPHPLRTTPSLPPREQAGGLLHSETSKRGHPAQPACVRRTPPASRSNNKCSPSPHPSPQMQPPPQHSPQACARPAVAPRRGCGNKTKTGTGLSVASGLHHSAPPHLPSPPAPRELSRGRVPTRNGPQTAGHPAPPFPHYPAVAARGAARATRAAACWPPRTRASRLPTLLRPPRRRPPPSGCWHQQPHQVRDLVVPTHCRRSHRRRPQAQQVAGRRR